MELAAGPSLTNSRRLVRVLAVAVFAGGLALSAARVVGTRFEPIFLIPAAMAVLSGWLMSRLDAVARVAGYIAVFAVSYAVLTVLCTIPCVPPRERMTDAAALFGPALLATWLG